MQSLSPLLSRAVSRSDMYSCIAVCRMSFIQILPGRTRSYVIKNFLSSGPIDTRYLLTFMSLHSALLAIPLRQRNNETNQSIMMI